MAGITDLLLGGMKLLGQTAANAVHNKKENIKEDFKQYTGYSDLRNKFSFLKRTYDVVQRPDEPLKFAQTRLTDSTIIKEPRLEDREFKAEKIRTDDVIKSVDTIHSDIVSYLNIINRNTSETFRYVKESIRRQDGKITDLQKNTETIRKSYDDLSRRLGRIDSAIKKLEQKTPDEEENDLRRPFSQKKGESGLGFLPGMAAGAAAGTALAVGASMLSGGMSTLPLAALAALKTRNPYENRSGSEKLISDEQWNQMNPADRSKAWEQYNKNRYSDLMSKKDAEKYMSLTPFQRMTQGIKDLFTGGPSDPERNGDKKPQQNQPQSNQIDKGAFELKKTNILLEAETEIKLVAQKNILLQAKKITLKADSNDTIILDSQKIIFTSKPKIERDATDFTKPQFVSESGSGADEGQGGSGFADKPKMGVAGGGISPPSPFTGGGGSFRGGGSTGQFGAIRNIEQGKQVGGGPSPSLAQDPWIRGADQTKPGFKGHGATGSWGGGGGAGGGGAGGGEPSGIGSFFRKWLGGGTGGGEGGRGRGRGTDGGIRTKPGSGGIPPGKIDTGTGVTTPDEVRRGLRFIDPPKPQGVTDPDLRGKTADDISKPSVITDPYLTPKTPTDVNKPQPPAWVTERQQREQVFRDPDLRGREPSETEKPSSLPDTIGHKPSAGTIADPEKSKGAPTQFNDSYLMKANPHGAELATVDPRLRHVMSEAYRMFDRDHPEYHTQVLGPSGGVRHSGSTANHGIGPEGVGRAIDTGIIEKATGKQLADRGNASGSGESFKLYADLHRAAKTAQEKLYPNMPLGSGFAFDTSAGSGQKDWQHIDLSHKQYDWSRPFQSGIPGKEDVPGFTKESLAAAVEKEYGRGGGDDPARPQPPGPLPTAPKPDISKPDSKPDVAKPSTGGTKLSVSEHQLDQMMRNISQVETGTSRGSTNISNDAGGTRSYGILGLNSGSGSAAHFARLHPEFGLTGTPGSSTFDSQWNDAIRKNPNDFYKAERQYFNDHILSGTTQRLINAGVDEKVAKDPRVLGYFSDREVQMGTELNVKDAPRIGNVFNQSGGDPEKFLKGMSAHDKDPDFWQGRFQKAIATGVYGEAGNTARVSRRESLALGITGEAAKEEGKPEEKSEGGVVNKQPPTTDLTAKTRNFYNTGNNPYQGVVLHTNDMSIDKQLKELGPKGLGYNYVYDREGNRFMFADPATTRPSHIKDPDHPERSGRPDLSNKNALGVGFIAGKGEKLSDAQVAAAKRDMPGYYKDLNIPLDKDGQPNYPVGHGEIQGNEATPFRSTLGPYKTPEGQQIAEQFRTPEGWKGVTNPPAQTTESPSSKGQMLILRGINNQLDEGPATEYAKKMGYEPKVLDVSGETGANSPQTKAAIEEIKNNPNIKALYGFSGGGFNVANHILPALSDEEKARLSQVTVLGAPGTEDKLKGPWNTTYREDPKEGHMAGPKALLAETTQQPLKATGPKEDSFFSSDMPFTSGTPKLPGLRDRAPGYGDAPYTPEEIDKAQKAPNKTSEQIPGRHWVPETDKTPGHYTTPPGYKPGWGPEDKTPAPNWKTDKFGRPDYAAMKAAREAAPVQNIPSNKPSDIPTNKPTDVIPPSTPQPQPQQTTPVFKPSPVPGDQDQATAQQQIQEQARRDAQLQEQQKSTDQYFKDFDEEFQKRSDEVDKDVAKGQVKDDADDKKKEIDKEEDRAHEKREDAKFTADDESPGTQDSGSGGGRQQDEVGTVAGDHSE